jgi:Sortase domain
LAHDHPPPGDFGATAPAVPATHLRHPASPHRPAPPSGVVTPAAAHAATTAPATAQPTVIAAVPTRLTIPAINVQASVSPVETVHGTLAVPDNPADVGWWAGGARPGASSGSVVLDGHVDSPAGPGALFRLIDLRPGDGIFVTAVARQVLRYTVIGRRAFTKAGPLPSSLFAVTGTPRLVLITCGGRFDRSTRSYQDNIALFAVPA